MLQLERWAGSVPFPPVSLKRQVVCLLLWPVFMCSLRGEPVSSYFSIACCSVVFVDVNTMYLYNVIMFTTCLDLGSLTRG